MLIGLVLLPVRSRRWALVVGGIALVMVPLGVGCGFINPYAGRLLARICILIIFAVSLNLINGLTGMFSIGHAGFVVLGAYTAGVMTKYLFRLPEMSLLEAVPLFLAALLAGGVVAAVFGLLVGLPTLRLRGDYLAIATIGFAEIICVVLKTISFRTEFRGMTFELGGPSGIGGIPNMPGPDIPALSQHMPIMMSFVFSLLVMFLTVWAISNFAASSHGRACAAIRDDETAAEILGVNTLFYKVGIFVLGAFFAGVGGGLLAHDQQQVIPKMGRFMTSIEYLIIVYLGGIGSISGSILAVMILTILQEALKDLLGGDAWRLVLYGVILIVIMIRRPQGLYGGREFPWLMPKPGRHDGNP